MWLKEKFGNEALKAENYKTGFYLWEVKPDTILYYGLYGALNNALYGASTPPSMRDWERVDTSRPGPGPW